MRPIVTLLTDFGLADAYAGVMKGVILGIAPEVTAVDLCHEVPPQDVQAGAFLLMASYAYFPAGTIHLAVVDPGVGTERQIVAVRAGDRYFVGPDNGLLRWAVDRAGGAAALVGVENPDYRLSQVSTTFHGRDVMAAAAAHLAKGVPLDALGPAVPRLAGEPFPEPERKGGALAGRVIYVDRYGNCITNLPSPDLPDGAASLPEKVEAAGHRLPLFRTYGHSPPGRALAVTGSAGFVELAVRNGNAARDLGLGVGAEVVVCE